jgi:uncharacterized SAM-binding protein YcdF (DUF218 family)
MAEKQINQLAQILWDYHRLNQKIEKVEAIFALGCYDPNVAVYAAQLYHEAWAPKVIFSGGVVRSPGTLLNDVPKTEAEAFFDIAIRMNVPQSCIVLENSARNTGENFQKTEQVLRKLHLKLNRLILVQKPYMERRVYATGKIWWPNKKLIITSQRISFLDYVKVSHIPKETTINAMVGDLHRIKYYPHKGYQIFQEIPPLVWEAGQHLLRLGFEKDLPNA